MAGMRRVHKGIAYFSVGGAATFIGTSTAKVKQLMTGGTLDWCNLKNNGPIFVTEASLIKYKLQLVDAKHAGTKSKLTMKSPNHPTPTPPAKQPTKQTVSNMLTPSELDALQQSANEQSAFVRKELARRRKEINSVPNKRLPSTGLLDEPSYFDTLEIWEAFLAEMEAAPDTDLKANLIQHAKEMITDKKRQQKNA